VSATLGVVTQALLTTSSIWMLGGGGERPRVWTLWGFGRGLVCQLDRRAIVVIPGFCVRSGISRTLPQRLRSSQSHSRLLDGAVLGVLSSFDRRPYLA
jgi:hypothetical protein